MRLAVLLDVLMDIGIKSFPILLPKLPKVSAMATLKRDYCGPANPLKHANPIR
jgi:hypothetical protein